MCSVSGKCTNVAQDCVQCDEVREVLCYDAETDEYYVRKEGGSMAKDEYGNGEIVAYFN